MAIGPEPTNFDTWLADGVKAVMERAKVAMGQDVEAARAEAALEHDVDTPKQPVTVKVARAKAALEHDVDAVLARLETGIATERKALDAVLDRLTQRTAA